jgi:hypothetical protein
MRWGSAWALSGISILPGERLLSPKQTLKIESREAEIGTHRTLEQLLRASEIEPTRKLG